MARPRLRTRDIKDRSLRNALSKSVKGDGRLSDDEVCQLLLSTLDGSGVTKAEREGLRLIASRSRSMSERARRLVWTFIKIMSVPRASSSRGGKKVDNKTDRMILRFMSRTKKGTFSKLDRVSIGAGLLTRVRDPTLIDQGASSLCGPAAFLMALATQRPMRYAKFAIRLFEKGEAGISVGGSKLLVKPGSDCRNSNPASAEMAHVDWLTLASLRDAMNSVFDYDDNLIYRAFDYVFGGDFRGATNPSSLAAWFRKAGFKVSEDASGTSNKGFANLQKADQLHRSGHTVCMLINADMLSSNPNSSGLTANHWVVLTSPIHGLTKNSSSIIFDVFTWGQGKRTVPKGVGSLSTANCLDNYYGYVAAKVT